MVAFIQTPLRLSLLLGCLVMGSVGLMGCQSSPVPQQDGSNLQAEGEVQTDRLDVTVTIPPQKYFVEKIGGDRLNVNVFVPGTSDPHTYEPKPQQLQALSETEAYVLVGLGFEAPWLDRLKSANGEMVLIDSSQGIEPLLMAAHDHSAHGHGEKEADHQEEHGHSGDHHEDHNDENHDEDPQTQSSLENGDRPSTADPHIWLSPTLVKQQATAIAASLGQLDPPNAAYYQGNLEKFLGEIEQLDQQIRQNLASVTPRKFIVFHPSWGYFSQDYDLEQIPIEVDGQEPSAQELGKLIDLAKQDNLNVIFAEPQFSPKNAAAIAAEIQGRVETIDPLAGNWSDNLLTVSQKIGQQNKGE
ncbi:MAG: metal ABC transporter solute-binding protein, Zn/Mn family [Synechocystis sp.]